MLKNYVVAMYLRLSKEDEREGESGSIANQRSLLTRYLDKHAELSQCQRIEYSDDGHSGTGFRRPGVIKLLESARNNEINCVIVKDLSRFGRNYIEVGSHLEQIFPLLGVRFISVNDNYDSFKDVSTVSEIETAFKILVYDLYSKDLSTKIKSAKLAKIKRGEFVAPFAPYGFKKSSKIKNKLEIDKDTAHVVRLIFKLALENKSSSEIVEILEYQRIPPPNTRWNTAAVRRILRDERYTGSMVGHKYSKPNILGVQKLLPREEWVTVPNAHEAIIPKKVFDEVLHHLNTRR